MNLWQFLYRMTVFGVLVLTAVTVLALAVVIVPLAAGTWVAVKVYEARRAPGLYGQRAYTDAEVVDADVVG